MAAFTSLCVEKMLSIKLKDKLFSSTFRVRMKEECQRTQKIKAQRERRGRRLRKTQEEGKKGA